MPRYNYSTRQWEKTPEEIEEEKRKAFEAQQEQSSVQRQVQTTRKKSFLENFLSAGLGNKIDVDFKNITSGYFKKPEAFKDGYQFGDINKTINSTGIKAMNEFTKGILNIGEGIGDTLTYGTSYALKKTGFLKNYIDPEELKKEAQKDIFNNLFKESDKMASKNSITDYKTDSIINSLGYMYGLQASAGLGKTTASQTAISTAVTFESAYGHGLTEAYNAGASDKDANLYALISASAEAGSELMFGGIGKGTKAVGLSKSAIPLDDIVAEKLSKNCKSMIMQNLTRAIVKSAGEGVEEIVSGFFSGLGKKLTYMKDEDFNKILKDENLLDQFISGMVSAGLSSAPSAYKATKNNQNLVTGRTASEDEIYNKMIENKTNEKLSEKNNRLKQKAINEEVKKVIAKKQEKFKNMKIDERKIRAEVAKNIDFDESTTELTKKELSDITESVDEAFEKGKLNFNYIYETYTPEETARLERLDKELSNKNLDKELEEKYQQEFNELLEQREEKINKEAEKNMFLQHTLYNEKLRRTNFELTKEEKKLVEKNKELKNFYEDAVKYGNNSEEAHRFFYALAKMSTQTEYQYRLTNSEELEQLGYNVNKKYKVSNGDTLESIANKYKISTEDIKKANNLTGNNIKVGQELIIPNKSAIINGLHDGDNKTIYINMDSENALNIIVGHETGHIFENTQEYTELKEMLFKIAEEDGTLADRRAELEELYKDVKNAKIDVELTNDLLGEKLFTDEKFIERLAEKPNLFTKIKDKIDDLVIKFKGTEEEKELRKIQNKFLEVYRKNNLQEYVAEADAKAKKETKKSTEKNVDFSIQFMKNNDKTPFVWLDSDISKLSKKQQEKYIINYINRLAGQTIGTTDGDSIYIIDNFINYKNKSKNKTSSGEFYYGPTQYSNLKGIATQELKNKILSELDNTIETSKYFKNKDDVGKRHSDYNIEKFDTRKSLVYDGNNVYEIKLDVAIMNDGTKIAYDLKQIAKKNSYLPFIPQKKNSAYKMAISQPPKLGLTSSLSNNIPQTQEKIKSDKADYSLSKKFTSDDLNKYKMYSGEVSEPIELGTIKLPNGDKLNITSQEINTGYETIRKIIGTKDNGTKAILSFTKKGVPTDNYDYKNDRVIYDYDTYVIKHLEGAEKNDKSGTTLLNELIKEAKNNNIKSIIADDTSHNFDGRPSSDYWEKMGFVADDKNNHVLNLKENNTKYSLSTKDSQGRTLSKEQQEYFKDSKVRDDNGNLLEVYHGTPYGGFEVFSYSNMGSKDGGGYFGDGFYFTNDLQSAEYYADADIISEDERTTKSGEYGNVEIKKVYLNVTNPYYIDGSKVEYKQGSLEKLLDTNASYESTNKLKRMGYDGVIYEFEDGTKEITIFNPNQVKNVDNKKPTSNPNIRYSLSVKEANTGKDNDGNKLSKGQMEKFADSKITDENGNLIKVYHTTGGIDVPFSSVQFNEFNPVGTPYYRFGDQVVNFFTDSKEMSGSYVDQQYVEADTTKITSVEQAESVIDYYNSSDLIEYTLKKNGRKYELYDERAEEVIHTFNSKEDLFKNITQVVQEESQLTDLWGEDAKGYQYNGYLNITNPYIVQNEKATNWNEVGKDYGEDLKEFYNNLTQNEKDMIKDVMGWEDWGIFKDELTRYYKEKYIQGTGDYVIPDNYKETLANLGKKLHDLYARDDSINVPFKALSDIYDIASDDFSEKSIEKYAYRNKTTNDIVFDVLEMNKNGSNYDGVVFENILDYGGEYDGERTPANVYVTFNSNQFKSADNKAPTDDADIRYSLSTKDNQGNKLSKEQQEYFKDSKARDVDGKLITFYHGTEANVGLPSEEKFTIFDRDRAGSHGSYYGSGFYFTTSLEDAKDYAHSKGDIYEVYLNIENPYIPSSDTINSDGKVEFAPSFYQDFENRFKDQLPQYWNDDTTNKGRVVRNILQDNGYDGVINGNTYVVFESNQIKNVDNTNPTDNPDIRYSLSKNNNTELNNYLEKNNFKLDDNGSLEYKELSNKQINSLVSIYRKNGYSDVSADYLRERLKESGGLKVPREVADRFIEKELGYRPEIDTTKVFEDAEGNQLTKNQVEFYKDSDVRDIRGRLIPVYHRTNAEFTIFDKKAGKQHGNKYGRGFYFSITPENYGNNEMKVYLNAKDGEYKYIPDMGYYIVQEPNMIKNVDNLNPTSNEDIRYSISKKGKLVDNKGNDVRLDVSDTGNTGTLMAMHNLNAEKLNGIIDLGGFPVPSIAITTTENVGSNQFGNISVLFNKDTIDPANRLNEVYDRDVWTPTFPKVEYNINNEMIRKMSKDNHIYYDNDDGIISHARLNYMYPDNLTDLIERRGLAGTLDKMKDDNELKYLYLKTKDNDYKPQMKPTKYSDDYTNRTLQNFIDNFKWGEMELPDFYYHYLNYGDMDLTDDQRKALKMSVRDVILPEIKQEAKEEYKKAFEKNKNGELSENDFVEKYINIMLEKFDESYFKYQEFIRDASRLYEFGETETIDENKTLEQVDKDINQKEYEKWIDDTFGNMIKNATKGIRNDKDLFTASGNRRSFNQLHEKYDLENIVKYMTSQKTIAGEKGFGAGSGFGTIQAQMSNRFNTLDDIRNSAKEKIVPNTQEQDLIKPYSEKIYNDMEELIEYYKYKNEKYSYPMDSVGYALNDYAGLKKHDITNLKKILNEYQFEIDKIPEKILNKVVDDINSLKNIPTDYFEAKPQRAVGLDEIQSVVLPTSTDESLKNKLKELNIDYVEYNPEIEGDRQRVINQFDNLKFSLSRKNNLAPIRGDYQVYSKDIRNNNLAPIREDITKKPASKNVNYSLNYAPTTYDDLENINKQYSEQPIVDENGNVETSEVINPMDDRNMDEVGKKNIKSYQYENPEVKPYYQEMARYMLNDLDNSVRGEKYATEDLDYMGTSRQTTDDIAYLLDEYDYSYDDIKKGLNAIIQDNGAENIAVAKRLEILINERLLNGYTDSYGYDIPANEEYKDLVRNQNLAPTRDEVDFSAFDAMLPIENELERLSGRNEEKYRKAREKYQEQIENAKKVRKQKGKAREAWDTAMRLLVNENHEIDRLAKDSKNTTLKHKADMLNNYVAEAENDINNYQTDYNGEEIGKSVKQLFEPAKEQGLYESFNDYLINWSNIDRHKQGKGSLRWESTSQNLINEYEDKYPQFKEWAKDVWKYGKNALNTMEQSGLIDEKLKKKLLKMYPHYVPYMDNADLNKFIGSSDEIVPKSTIKTARGGMSTTKILPMEDALTRYAYSYRKSMRQNDLYKEIVNTLRANEISDIGAGDTRKEVTDLKESLYRDENGNYLKAYIDGDTKVVSISDDLFNSLQNNLKYQIKDLEEKLSFITKPVQTATKIKGNLVTSWNPTFIATNLMKDFQDAIFNSTDTAKFLKNYPSAFKELVQNKSKEVRQFRALYGSGTGQYIGSDIADKTTPKRGKGLLSKIKSANEIIELAPRFAEFKASLQNGASIAEAMYNAREVTTNFTRGGTITKAMNRNGFNFINASTQGFDKFIRNMSGQNGAKAFTGTLLKAIAYGVAPAVFNELVFGSGDDKDEEYDALPDYIKDNYYLFKMNNGEFVRIPKGRALSVFGSGARRMIEYMNGEKDAFKGYGTNTWNQIGFNNPEESFLFTPFIQTKNNKAWYGGDIVPKRLQDKPVGEQYDEKTDLFSKWLGKTINKSPKKINYLIDQYSGGAGDVILPFLTPEATNEYDNPGLRAIAPLRDKFVVNSTDDNKYVSDFYTMNDELKVKANSDYATDEDILRYKYSNSVSSELASLYKEKRLIQSDTSLSNSEKYKKASAIKKQINEIAKEGVKTFNDVNAVGNYAQVNDREFYKNTKGEWTKARDEDTEEINKFGLTATEKNNYYNTKNTISGISNKYKELSAKASKEEKEELSTLKKAEIINSIKSTDITNDAKAYLYNKYYGSDTKMNVITTLGIDMNKYLDFELQNFTSDKDANGKSIKNSKKTKMINYINNMSGSYGEKIVIYKLHNMSDNTYNNEIVNYVKSQNISDTEKRAILEALNIEVDKSGNVRWK